MKQKILKQVVEKLSAQSKLHNPQKIFDLGKDIITECPADDDINDYIDEHDADMFDSMGFIYIPNNGANPDALRFVDGIFRTYPEAYDYLSEQAKAFEPEYKDLPDATAFRNYIDSLIRGAVGRMTLSDYNRQKAKDQLVCNLRYIVRKAIEEYKNKGCKIECIEKSLKFYAQEIHPFG